MRNNLKLIVAIALSCVMALCAIACSKDNDEASATPLPVDTQAPMIVVTPAPTPIATPSETATPEPSEGEGSPSASSSSSSSGVLKREMEGDDVTEVQERLQSLGYLDKVTGYFGTDTERAVKEFQDRNDLDSDGMVGPATLEALMSENAREAN